MDSLSEIVDVVIGVDTHVATHSAAAVGGTEQYYLRRNTVRHLFGELIAMLLTMIEVVCCENQRCGDKSVAREGVLGHVSP